MSAILSMSWVKYPQRHGKFLSAYDLNNHTKGIKLGIPTYLSHQQKSSSALPTSLQPNLPNLPKVSAFWYEFKRQPDYKCKYVGCLLVQVDEILGARRSLKKDPLFREYVNVLIKT